MTVQQDYVYVQGILDENKRLRALLEKETARADMFQINEDERAEVQSEVAQELLEKMPLLWRANGCNCMHCITHRGIRTLVALCDPIYGVDFAQHSLIRRRRIEAKEGC